MGDNIKNRTDAAEKIANSLPETNFQEITENVILNCFPNLEYEVRYYFKHPKNHINEEQYNRLIYMFDSNEPSLEKFKSEESYTNKSKNIDRTSKFRCKYSKEGKIEKCIKKIKLLNEDECFIKNHGMRISISNEINLLEDEPIPEKFETSRKIDRTSYTLGNYRYDISEITMGKKDSYEFEIEYVGNEVPVNVETLKNKMKRFIYYLSFGKI